MQKNINRLRHRLSRYSKAGRITAMVLTTIIILGGMLAIAAKYQYVTIQIDNGQAKTLLTTQRNLLDILDEADVDIGDNYDVLYSKGARNTASFFIETAFPVTITADGKPFTAEFREGTVADLLAASGIRLKGEDFIEPAADTPLARGLDVQVHRVSYTTETRQEEPDPVLMASYILSLDDPEEFIESHDDNYEVIYENRCIDGKIVSTSIIGMTPMVTFLKPRPLDSFTFETGVPCSRIEGFEDVKVGADGIPLNYTSKWDSAVCTAYSASRGRGSSGLGLYCGTVAVNPNRIPYGSRMYITSADGSFVYGFAIATDTGTAMMEGYVDIDLFFETNAECRTFGKRNLAVYFLD